MVFFFRDMSYDFSRSVRCALELWVLEVFQMFWFYCVIDFLLANAILLHAILMFHVTLNSFP